MHRCSRPLVSFVGLSKRVALRAEYRQPYAFEKYCWSDEISPIQILGQSARHDTQALSRPNSKVHEATKMSLFPNLLHSNLIRQLC